MARGAPLGSHSFMPVLLQLVHTHVRVAFVHAHRLLRSVAPGPARCYAGCALGYDLRSNACPYEGQQRAAGGAVNYALKIQLALC